MTFPTFFTDLDYQADPIDAIALSDDQLAAAAQHSQTIPQLEQQWSVYLHHLALQGLIQWLEERAPELGRQFDQASIHHSPMANLLSAVCHVQVNGLQLCLLTAGQILDDWISVPRAAVDLPELMPQLYVLLEVIEEQGQVRVAGHLTRSHLESQRQAQTLSAAADWTYDLPFHWFNTDPDALLLHLRCGVDATTASIPSPEPLPQAAIASMQQRLQQLQDVLQNPATAPWEVLSWEVGAIILQSAALMQQVYDIQTASVSATVPTPNQQEAPQSADDSTAQPNMGQQVMNVAYWLRDQLDDVAQELSWVLMPNLNLAADSMRSLKAPETNEMRSSAVAELGEIATQLQQQGLPIPNAARAAYRDLKWAGSGVRLYVVTWPLTPLTVSDPPEWSLLVIASPHPDLALPPGLRLIIRDDSSVLSDHSLTSAQQSLYAQVIGSQSEPFWITVDLTHGATVTLPPLTYAPDQI